MYLTRFHLDPRTRPGARALEDAQRMHSIVAAATEAGSSADTGGPRTLWRIDRDDPRAPLLWVLSPVRPDLDEFAADAGRVVGGVVYDSRAYSPLLERLKLGQVYAFRLAANAARSGKKSTESMASKRFGHVTSSQQLAWLETRAVAHGFTLRTSMSGEGDVAVVGRRRLVFSRRGERVTIALSEFLGHLEVSDVDRFRRSLVTGIGHARAYGCGLLTLAAPRRA